MNNNRTWGCIKLHSILLLILTCLTGLAQGPEGTAAQLNLDQLGQGGGNQMVRTFDSRYEGVKGSPFYNEDWIEGTIKTIKGEVYEQVKLKYNSHEDELLMFHRNKSIYVTKDQIVSFTLKDGSKSEEFVKLTDKENTQFYKVIYAGKVSLYEKIENIFRKADYQGGYSANRPYDEFTVRSLFYYESPKSKGIQKLKGSLSKVSSIFDSKAGEIKKYITVNDLDLKESKDLARIAAYYDELVN